MREEMYHMSAVNSHTEGQLEAAAILGEGRGRRDRRGMAGLQPSGLEGIAVFL